jgi:hypothetical protein
MAGVFGKISNPLICLDLKSFEFYVENEIQCRFCSLYFSRIGKLISRSGDKSNSLALSWGNLADIYLLRNASPWFSAIVYCSVCTSSADWPIYLFILNA